MRRYKAVDLGLALGASEHWDLVRHLRFNVDDGRRSAEQLRAPTQPLGASKAFSFSAKPAVRRPLTTGEVTPLLQDCCFCNSSSVPSSVNCACAGDRRFHHTVTVIDLSGCRLRTGLHNWMSAAALTVILEDQ